MLGQSITHLLLGALVHVRGVPVLSINNKFIRMVQCSAQDESGLNQFLQTITGSSRLHKQSPFLAKLPPEVRRNVYQYLLPRTIALREMTGRIAHVWLHGSTAIMSTCKKIHEETADIIYGESVFIVEVGYDTIAMRHRRLLGSGLVPEATPAFLELVSSSNLRRIRQLAINVKHVDSYTGQYA